ncbi:MAG: M23 family metallopeptidase [Pseudonocardiaceae bacterium]
MIAAVAAGAVSVAAQHTPPDRTGEPHQRKAIPLAFTGMGGDAPATGVLPLPEFATIRATAEDDVAGLAKGQHLADHRAQAAATAARHAAEQPAAAVEPDRAGELVPGGVVAPTVGVITSNYGSRWGTTHYGLDIANDIGTAVVAVMDGEIIDSGPASGFGLWVRIRHDDGTVTVYGHINETLVSEGQRVTAGEQIATVGNRGLSTGPHLHFEVHLDGERKTDPLTWLRRNGVQSDGTTL